MRFCRFTLRTTNVEAARAFYAKVLGEDCASIVTLHEEAVAHGARAHWLGMVGVDDVNGMADAFVEHGAARLGPTQRNADGEFAVVRDPGGAVVAVATSSDVQPPIVGWHILNTLSLAKSASAYASMFGWHIHGTTTHEGEVFHQFAYSSALPPTGALTDIAGRSDRHAHWLFFFRVPSLETSIASVRRCGGSANVPLAGFVVCDDAQGAAFGLTE